MNMVKVLVLFNRKRENIKFCKATVFKSEVDGQFFV